VSADDATDLDFLACPPNLRLDGRVVWLTGASRGLGRALAFALAGAGAELLLSARSEAPLEEVAPGYLTTEMTAGLHDHPKWGEALRARIPMGRFASTAEVTPAVLSLASPGASYVTGTTPFVDGSWTAG
jgi:NAD(P)-dependent dehydrogenase (short-subunit alcohol dehydrogenase family)